MAKIVGHPVLRVWSTLRVHNGIWFALILLGAIGCPGRTQKETVVARVGNQVLTLEEIAVFTSSGKGGPVPGEAKREFVRQWIDTEVLYREALREKLHKDRRIRGVIRQMEKELLAAELMERRVGSQMALAEREIEDYYIDHRDEFILTEPRIRARHILVDSEEKAKQVRDRLQKGESFEDLVRETSLDTATIAAGGDLGMISEDDVVPAIGNVAFLLEVDEISEPIRTEWGYHIIQVTDVKPAGSMMALGEVREEIANRIFASKQRLAFDRLMKELKENEQIEVNWDLIESEVSAEEKVHNGH
ncbi:MAG: peptidylprolyl isomerase [bacterium]